MEEEQAAQVRVEWLHMDSSADDDIYRHCFLAALSRILPQGVGGMAGTQEADIGADSVA